MSNIYQHKQLQERRCRKCKQTKDCLLFVKNSKSPSGYRNLCKDCMKIESKYILKNRRKNKLCHSCGRKSLLEKTQCKKCKDRDVARVVKHRIELKKKCVSYLGGQCVDCGITSKHYSIYDFHHIDPSNKNITINKLLSIKPKWETLKAELDKCVLLCSNCHRIKHEKTN